MPGVARLASAGRDTAGTQQRVGGAPSPPLQEDGPFDDMVGPFVLGAVMLVLLLSVFVSTVVGVTRSLA